MIKTALTTLAVCLIAALAIRYAVKAMRHQIAHDAAENDVWSGAKRFGGNFQGDKPPPEAEIRRAWTPVRAPSASVLAKPGSASGELGEAQLRKYVAWCDKRCTAGWLIVLPAGGAATIWFQDPADAQGFARAWHPLAAT